MSRWNAFRSLAIAAVAGLSLMIAAVAQAGAATDFTLRNVDGEAVTLSDYKGKVVLLSFWATWCGPCKVEMKHLHQYAKDMADDGLVVLFISTDDPRTAPQVKPFVKRNRYDTELFLLDKQSQVVGIYNPPKTLPFGVLIDREFNVAKQYSGYTPGDEKHVLEDIRNAMSSGKAPAPAPEEEAAK